MRLKVVTVIGAWLLFIKAAAVSREFASGTKRFFSIRASTTTTKMSGIFFEGLDIPTPDVNLEVGSGSHGSQTGAMLGKIRRGSRL